MPLMAIFDIIKEYIISFKQTMKKIFISILGILALVSGSSAYAQDQVTNRERKLDLPCVQSAVAVRETAIQNAFKTFSASIGTALSNRGTSLNTAWGMTNGPERRAARKTAWETYRKASNEARATFKSSKKSAWEAFKTASKACKVEVVESEENDNL